MELSNKRKRELDSLIIDISKKLSNVKYVQNFISANETAQKYTSVAVSYPALCILFSELQLHFSQCEFDVYAHKYLEIVNNYLGQNNIYDISLFDGLCGVGFAANCMSDNGKYYQSFIENLNEHIVSIVDTNILKYKNLPLNEFFYDTMYGLTGTANYLMNFKSEHKIQKALLCILQYLTEICKIGDDGIPKFAIQTDQSKLFSLANAHKARYVNLGIAHGIPGILLVLSKSYESGISVSNQLETIKYLSEYISDSCVRNNNNRIFWESQKIIGIDSDRIVPSRDAWCYGTPGVAYSLLIASKILNDAEMCNLAIDGMKESLKKMRKVISPTFCHGISGLCCLSRKFYEQTNVNYFYETYMKLVDYLLDLYSNENPFGFKDKEVVKGQVTDRNEIGLLTGTSGVLLTLLSCYRPIKTHWDSIFLF